METGKLIITEMVLNISILTEMLVSNGYDVHVEAKAKGKNQNSRYEITYTKGKGL